MLYIAENLKSLRKAKDLTQEEVAEMLGVSPQSVSKWERGETLPDITLLPALANLYHVSVDALIGMDKINDRQAKNALFAAGHAFIRTDDLAGAIRVYADALRQFPNDGDVLCDLAMARALEGGAENLRQAAALCERVLASGCGEKVRHTASAALCFIYLKAGDKEKAVAAACQLPHMRESREQVLVRIENGTRSDEIDRYLKFIAIGENDETDLIEIRFGLNLLPVCTEHGLIEKIQTLRAALDAPETREGFKRLPLIRIRDNAELPPNWLRVRYYSDYLLDKKFDCPADAVEPILKILKHIAETRQTRTA